MAGAASAADLPLKIIAGADAFEQVSRTRWCPTSALSATVRFKAGSVEPAHHHTFGHDLVVIKGKKSVWNLSKKERADLIDGDYLFTPVGDVRRVKTLSSSSLGMAIGTFP